MRFFWMKPPSNLSPIFPATRESNRTLLNLVQMAPQRKMIMCDLSMCMHILEEVLPRISFMMTRGQGFHHENLEFIYIKIKIMFNMSLICQNRGGNQFLKKKGKLFCHLKYFKNYCVELMTSMDQARGATTRQSCPS